MKSKERLKIIFLAAWYPSEENSVAGIFIREHAKAVALYNDVTVIAFSGASRSLQGLYEVTENIEDGIKTIRIKYKISPIPKTGYFIHIWGVLSYFRKMLKKGYKPDIIHAHVYSAGVPAVILGRLYKIPVVITEHWSGFPRRLLTVKDKIMARFAMNRAKVILPVSDNLRKAIEDYGIKNKFCVVPNVVNTEMFYPLPDGAKKNNETKRILMVALLTPVKGVPYLLEALHQIKKKRQDFVLDIVGDGPYRSEYEKMVNDLELRDVVKFHGLKPKEEVAEFMRQADFFVLSSLFETFGVVFIEALASGKPVIAANVGGPNEIITEEVGLLVPPKNAEALSKTIDYMLDHYQEYSPEKVAKYARDRFSYEAVGQMLDGIYRENSRRKTKVPKYKVGNSGYEIEIQDGWRVLDVGSGHNPHPKANVLLDKHLKDDTERSGKPLKADKERGFVEGDAESMPFGNKEFDYIIASHIAEHVDNPEKFCKELMRVGRKGYIETPSKFAEILFDESCHKWYVYVNKGVLVFEEITRRARLGLIGQVFYAAFYVNIERVGKKTISFSNRYLRYISSKIVTYLFRRPLVKYGKLYTCFEWDGHFEFKIVRNKEAKTNDQS